MAVQRAVGTSGMRRAMLILMTNLCSSSLINLGGETEGSRGEKKCHLPDKKRLKAFWRRNERLQEEREREKKNVKVDEMQRWHAGSEERNYVTHDASNMTKKVHQKSCTKNRAQKHYR